MRDQSSHWGLADLQSAGIMPESPGGGGNVTSIVSKTASIGHFGTVLGEGLCVMRNTIIENDVQIGEGSLIHNGSIISHDAHIGRFCEISPGAKILGRDMIGDLCHIGGN